MRVQIPPLERSLRTPTSRRSSSPRPTLFLPSCRTCSGIHRPAGTSVEAFAGQWTPEQVRGDGGGVRAPEPNITANAGRTTWFQSPGRGFESRLAERLVAQLDRAGNVRPTPRRREPSSSWRMPVGLHPVVAERSSGSNPRVSSLSSPAPIQSGECRVGLHPATMALTGPSHAFLVAGNHYTLANAGGTTGRALAFGQEVGGSTPPPGNRVAQKKCLAEPRRRHRLCSRCECRAGLHFNPRGPVRVRPGFMPVAQREELRKMSRHPLVATAAACNKDNRRSR